MVKLNVRKGLDKGSKKKKTKDVLSPLPFSESFDDYVEDKRFDWEDEENASVSPTSFADSSFGKILHAIKVSKNENLLDDEVLENDFNAFMIMRFLSMNEENCDLLEMVDEYQDILTKKEFFKLLVKIIPKGKSFDKFINQKKDLDDDTVLLVAKYYSVGLRESRQYCKMMGPEWCQEIKRKFGGMRK